ncbi:hypothetical protein [Georgenia sp. SUBG003]|uniref:hypothetical protein n=1 Tax=Georgenia sp. SUBG003 TaxID=1497974 RepID=UPI003AB5EBD4
MSDTYLELVNSGITASLAKKLGLPRPARLRRTDPASVDSPLTPGPVLVLSDANASAEADTLAQGMLDWDLDVRRDTRLSDHERWGAVVLVLTGLRHPAGLAAPALELGSVLRGLSPGGRVVTLSRTSPTAAPSCRGPAGWAPCSRARSPSRRPASPPGRCGCRRRSSSSSRRPSGSPC